MDGQGSKSSVSYKSISPVETSHFKVESLGGRQDEGPDVSAGQEPILPEIAPEKKK